MKNPTRKTLFRPTPYSSFPVPYPLFPVTWYVYPAAASFRRADYKPKWFRDTAPAFGTHLQFTTDKAKALLVETAC